MSITNKQEQGPRQPLRVLMVTGVYPTAQRPHAGTFIKSQVDSLIAAGVEVEVLHPQAGPSPLRYSQAALQVLLKTLTRRFTVIHGHYGLWCLITRLQWTTPVVASFLGDDLLGTVTAEGDYSKKGAFVVRISRWLCRHVDAVIVKSAGMKKSAGEREHIFVIPNGVNFAMFQPVERSEARAALGWDQNRYYVLFANDPAIPVKNFALAQKSIECLRARGIEAELVVAKGLPHATVMQYMNACNTLLLPSVAEGSPNVVKEAMACNVPVVATNVGDVAQVIGHTAGCSVCPHDPEALAIGLEKALLHTERTTGRADIQYLDSAVVAQQVIDVYKYATQKKAKGRGERVRLALEKESVHGKES